MYRAIFTAVILIAVVFSSLPCDTSASSAKSHDPKAEASSNVKADTPSPSESVGAPVDLFGTAVVRGRIRFDGEHPSPRMIRKEGDYACHSDASVLAPGTIIAEDGGLPYVFIYIKSGVQGKYSIPTESVRLGQHECMFVPHVFGIRVGQTIEITNGDETAHNVVNVSKRNPRFNVSQPNKGVISKQVFSQQEIMIKLVCNVHGWMEAYCGVLPHPFFAVTNESGGFEITRLPPGEYVIEAWHELWGTQQQTIHVEDGKALEVNFTYTRVKKTT